MPLRPVARLAAVVLSRVGRALSPGRWKYIAWTPLRAMYFASFAALVGAAFLAPEFVRPAGAVVGMIMAVFGALMTLNLFGAAAEAAEFSKTSKSSPPEFASVTVNRLLGVVFLLAGLCSPDWQCSRKTHRSVYRLVPDPRRPAEPTARTSTSGAGTCTRSARREPCVPQCGK